jgi:uncharacterized protein YbaR (Trm112 family)
VIDRDFLALLVCPVCKGPLEPALGTAGEEELLCRRCALAYPVRDGIPMLVREDARAIDGEPAPRRD